MRLQNIFNFKAQAGRNKAPVSRPQIASDNCPLPQNPYKDINASNQTSWYSATSNFMSGLLKSEACVESDITDGILTGNPSFNPQDAIHKKFQIAALLSKSYDLLKAAIDKQLEFLKSLKDTHNPALAAE